MNWKMRSKIYHMMTPDPGDDLGKETIIEEWDHGIIHNRAREYCRKQTTELYYPAKSYAIATVYAILLEKHFGGNAKDYLKDPELLAGNDPYFEPLSDDNWHLYSDLWLWYDEVLNDWPESLYCENFKKTLDYFYKEFLLAEDTKIYLPPEERRD